MGTPLPFDSLDQLRRTLFEAHPHLAELDRVAEPEWRPVPAGEMGDAPFRSTVRDHYLSNPVARASETMAELSRLARERGRALAAE
jgi:NADH-quinone oxidoreductase subunit G